MAAHHKNQDDTVQSAGFVHPAADRGQQSQDLPINVALTHAGPDSRRSSIRPAVQLAKRDWLPTLQAAHTREIGSRVKNALSAHRRGPDSVRGPQLPARRRHARANRRRPGGVHQASRRQAQQRVSTVRWRRPFGYARGRSTDEPIRLRHLRFGVTRPHPSSADGGLWRAWLDPQPAGNGVSLRFQASAHAISMAPTAVPGVTPTTTSDQ